MEGILFSVVHARRTSRSCVRVLLDVVNKGLALEELVVAFQVVC